MQKKDPQVKRKVLMTLQHGPTHLLQPVKKGCGKITAWCLERFTLAFLPRGAVRSYNIRGITLGCPTCNEIAQEIVKQEDSYYQGDLYEE